jgi:hypothetical protein
VLPADELRPIYERNGHNAQRTADDIGIAASTLKGWSSYREIRNPFVVTGRSTLRNLQTGEDVLVWEKESLDRQAEAEAREAAFEALAETLPRERPTVAPVGVIRDLCNLYTFTDYHLGMLAQEEEGGANWDLEDRWQHLDRQLRFDGRAEPFGETAIINLQGDFLHTDGLTPVTPAHGHVLDADSRYSKIVKVAIKAIRQLVAMALEKHQDVRLIIAEGNHDESGSIWLRQMFDALYELEPRVTVDTSELPVLHVPLGRNLPRLPPRPQGQERAASAPVRGAVPQGVGRDLESLSSLRPPPPLRRKGIQRRNGSPAS